MDQKQLPECGREASACDVEAALNSYIDGELPSHDQSVLFDHLAHCTTCRAHLERMLSFRRMLRHETPMVPPSLDEQFLTRFSEHQERNMIVNRSVDRNPLWRTRRSVSVGVALLAALGLFLAGFFTSTPPAQDAVPVIPAVVEGFEERVDIRSSAATSVSPLTPEPIYVYYPDITVEAERPSTDTPLDQGSM